MDSTSIHSRELEAALEYDAKRTFEAAGSAAQSLARISELARDVGERDAFRDADAEELDRRATGLRGCALHALAVALEIAYCAGRLAQLADVRRGLERATDDAESNE
jgi:hypothetical protein